MMGSRLFFFLVIELLAIRCTAVALTADTHGSVGIIDGSTRTRQRRPSQSRLLPRFRVREQGSPLHTQISIKAGSDAKDGWFQQIDADGSGFISEPEFNAKLKANDPNFETALVVAGLIPSAQRKQALENKLNAGKFSEIAGNTVSPAGASESVDPKDVFKRIDANNDGEISLEEYNKALTLLDSDDRGSVVRGIARFHRCEFVGLPHVLKVPGEEGWDGRGWRFAHQFTEAECSGGMPTGECFSGLHRTYHCGRDEQWMVLSDPPSIEWTNWHPCKGGIASVSADFICVDDPDKSLVHQCSFEGKAQAQRRGTKKKKIAWPLPAVAPPSDASRNKTAASGDGGWYRHEFVSSECSFGLPTGVPLEQCVASLSGMRHCGGDHDWMLKVEGASLTAEWFTSFGCNTAASVQANLYCPPQRNDVHLWHCSYTGPGNEGTPACNLPQMERHANEAATGQCLRHAFKADECIDAAGSAAPEGWFAGKVCLSVIRGAQQCGQEEDWRIIGSDEHSILGQEVLPPEVLWWNAQPCGNASIAVDFLCLPAPRVLIQGRSSPMERVISSDVVVETDVAPTHTIGQEHVFPSKRSEGWRESHEDMLATLNA